MAYSKINVHGWISVPIDEKYERLAKQLRAERDKRYRNIFTEVKGDERWVGELGEKVFNSWLKHKEITNYNWILARPVGRPDFVLANGIRIGVKTVKRQDSPQKNYTAQITSRHRDEPADHFFFMSYDIKHHVMWLLGGIDKTSFLEKAHVRNEGELVHANYRVRRGHQIRNIEITKLLKSEDWLNTLVGG